MARSRAHALYVHVYSYLGSLAQFLYLVSSPERTRGHDLTTRTPNRNKLLAIAPTGPDLPELEFHMTHFSMETDGRSTVVDAARQRFSCDV